MIWVTERVYLQQDQILPDQFPKWLHQWTAPPVMSESSPVPHHHFWKSNWISEGLFVRLWGCGRPSMPAPLSTLQTSLRGVAPPSLFPYFPFLLQTLEAFPSRRSSFIVQLYCTERGNNSKWNKTKWKQLQQQTQVEMNILGITRGSEWSRSVVSDSLRPRGL